MNGGLSTIRAARHVTVISMEIESGIGRSTHVYARAHRVVIPIIVTGRITPWTVTPASLYEFKEEAPEIYAKLLQPPRLTFTRPLRLLLIRKAAMVIAAKGPSEMDAEVSRSLPFLLVVYLYPECQIKDQLDGQWQVNDIAGDACVLQEQVVLDW
nr:hypothetical protein CFP56_41474 [Quercus suber]